jgi:hypothetical protein
MNRATIINAVLFQLVWFACVVGGGSYGWFWPGVVATLALIVSVRNASTVRHDVLLAMVLTPAGWMLDTLWIYLGVLDFHGLPVAPSWIVLLWLSLALSINHSLAFFRDRPLVGAVAVMLTAPLSYLAGERLGAVLVPDVMRLGWISLAWGVLFYGVFRVACSQLPSWTEEAAAS